jgi:DNA invertase Pin-like site-specific DNA recombinase
MTNTEAQTTARRQAWGVIRCSTKMQADSGLGLEAQRRKIVAYCEANDLDLVAIREDVAKSGARTWKARPGIAQAVKDAAKGGTIVAASVSRLGRNTADVLDLVETAHKAGASVVAVDSPLDLSTPTGMLMLSMMASVAQFERAELRSRTIAANAVKRSRGERTTGPKSNIAPEARELMHRRRAEGASLRAIADELNAAGYVTGRGLSKWSHGGVQMALKAYRVIDGEWINTDPGVKLRGRRVTA